MHPKTEKNPKILGIQPTNNGFLDTVNKSKAKNEADWLIYLRYHHLSFKGRNIPFKSEVLVTEVKLECPREQFLAMTVPDHF